MRGGTVLWMFTSTLCFFWHHGRGLLTAEHRVCTHWSRHSRFLPASQPTRFLARRQRLGVPSLPFPCGDHVCLFTRKSVDTFYKRDRTHVKRVKVPPGTHVHFYTLGVFLLAITSVYSCMWGEAFGGCAGRTDQLLFNIYSVQSRPLITLSSSLHRYSAENEHQTAHEAKQTI